MAETPDLSGFLPRTDHPIRLSAFEGPLDLLLFLIRRQEIDIYDIPIGQITRQYLEILRQTEVNQLEVAGEFFVMAATLMQIKSRLLLPPEKQSPEDPAEADEDEALDPRWELVQQLLEYRRFKEAASGLAERMEATLARIERRVEEPPVPAETIPLQPLEQVEIWQAFNRVLRRLAEKVQVGEIHAETVTVAERMEAILARLRFEAEFTFTDLLTEVERPSSVWVVATFLAMLELTRLKRLTLQQDAAFADITCRRRDPEEEPSLLNVEPV